MIQSPWNTVFQLKGFQSLQSLAYAVSFLYDLPKHCLVSGSKKETDN